MKKVFLFFTIIFSLNITYGAKIDFIVTPGLANFDLKIATNYTIFSPPWNYPLSTPQVELSSSLPIAFSRWQPELSGVLPEDIFGINPTFSPIISMGFKPSTDISISLPFMYSKLTKEYGIKGAIKAGYVKNLDFNLSANTSNLKLNKYPKESDDIPLRFQAVLNMPLAYYMRWNSFYIDYTLSPSRFLKFSFQLAKHTFQLYTDNYVNIDFLGYAEVNNSKIPIQYNLPDKDGDEVYSWAQGDFTGSKWMPTFGIEAYLIKLNLRFGSKIPLEGYYNMGYSLPFFIKPDSIYAAVTGTGSSNMGDSAFIDWDALISNPSKIGNGEVVSKTYYTTDNGYGTIPTSLTVGIDIIPKRLNFTWTHFFGSFVLNHIDKLNTTFGTNGVDSAATYGRENFYLNVTINNILLLSAEYKYYELMVGYMDLSASFDKNNKASSLPMPILGASAKTLTKLQLFVSGFVSPIPSIKGGFKIKFQ